MNSLFSLVILKLTDFINKKGNKMLSFLGESEYYRRVVCRASIFGFSLVANKNREVSFMHSLYLLKFSVCKVFPFKLM